MLESDEEIAQEQIDQLSLVTRYAGTGYNLVRGNPEGDFNRGGIDPGIKTTNEIFSHTYTMRKKAFYLGRAMDVPDQVKFHMTHSCAASQSVQAYSTWKEELYERAREKCICFRWLFWIICISIILTQLWYGPGRLVYKYLKQKNSLSTSVSGRYGLYSGSASLSMSKLNENINHNTRLGKKVIQFTIGTRSIPLPIHIKLIPIIKALDPIWWGGYGGWWRKRITLRPRNLARAVRDYIQDMSGKKSITKLQHDPTIRVKITPQWPDGTYALLMP